VIYFTAVVAALVFAYLLAAMIRPEWFDKPRRQNGRLTR
jgi:K+-transporting ATPase KdpF subunit